MTADIHITESIVLAISRSDMTFFIYLAIKYRKINFKTSLLHHSRLETYIN